MLIFKGVPLHEAALAAVEHLDAVVTAIIPVPDTYDDLVEVVPIQSIPTFLVSLFCNLKEDWVRESILKGVEVIIGIISNHGSARDLLANRARVSQSLSALHSMIDIYKLSTIEICWLSSRIDEIFGVVETTMKIKELVDVNWIKALSDQDLTCSSEITYIEDQLDNLSNKASKLKVKEQEILREEERISKMREDLTIQEQFEILSRFKEKGSRIGESGLGRSGILKVAGFGEGEEPSQEFDWLYNLL
ncbi:hypothetical protein Cgig2_027771 [Carnegiea gigantea]|uniref:Uncharacterized protein n=1 Tax=Carnegiea gigantea TaxID=171969 RepID=A0A9Q1GRE0_9CARY|nr:hypothetical protein Cgig2_027771 [Carnegiea gigantea]